MAARPLVPLLLLTVLLILGACKDDRDALATMAEATALTDALVATIRDAPDPAEGVARAQARLDAQEDDLEARLGALWRLENDALSRDVQTSILAERNENLAKMATLERDLLPRTLGDPALEAALSALVRDHQALLAAR